MRRVVLILSLIFSLGIIAGCDSENDAASQERNTNQNNYESLQDKQPAEEMDYSPTREGINKWIETWEEPGKISYVYLVNSDGVETGYFVFEGLPVAYDASLTPPEKTEWEHGNLYERAAPSMDGVYYSGGNTTTYYGFDAISGSYIMFSVGGSQNMFITEKPLPRDDIKALGYATIDDVENK